MPAVRKLSFVLCLTAVTNGVLKTGIWNIFLDTTYINSPTCITLTHKICATVK
jgi:hypothetical protein